MKVAFRVSPHLASWSSDIGTFDPLVLNEMDVSAEQAKLIAAAEAAGSLLDVDVPTSARNSIEPDEVSMKKMQAAMEPYDPETGSPTGPWLKGHLANLKLEG
jgi:hypothetical protein